MVAEEFNKAKAGALAALKAATVFLNSYSTSDSAVKMQDIMREKPMFELILALAFYRSELDKSGIKASRAQGIKQNISSVMVWPSSRQIVNGSTAPDFILIMDWLSDNIAKI